MESISKTLYVWIEHNKIYAKTEGNFSISKMKVKFKSPFSTDIVPVANKWSVQHNYQENVAVFTSANGNFVSPSGSEIGSRVEYNEIDGVTEVLDDNQNNLFDEHEFGLIIGRMEDYEDTEEIPSNGASHVNIKISGTVHGNINVIRTINSGNKDNPIHVECENPNISGTNRFSNRYRYLPC